jgi:hypothetical protein
MRITKNGLTIENWIEFTLRPNICSFKDKDEAVFNINTITLINMYRALENELQRTHGLSIQDILDRYHHG